MDWRTLYASRQSKIINKPFYIYEAITYKIINHWNEKVVNQHCFCDVHITIVLVGSLNYMFRAETIRKSILVHYIIMHKLCKESPHYYRSTASNRIYLYWQNSKNVNILCTSTIPSKYRISYPNHQVTGDDFFTRTMNICNPYKTRRNGKSPNQKPVPLHISLWT